MKTRLSVILAIVLLGVGFTFWQVRLVPPAVAGEESAVVAAASCVLGAGEGYEYVGSKKCKKCHSKVFKSWEKTKHGQTFEVLKPDQGKEAKVKAKLDPAKDYTQDASCLACHATGYGKPGGYAIPEGDPVENKKAFKAAQALEGVGCESCHGPGSAYLEVFDEIKKSKRMYKLDELHAVGLTKVEEALCTSCHNDKSPTMDPAKPFDFAKQKDEGIHEHEELKQREG